MNFEPQCKEQADLYDHMARVLRMCKAAGFNEPWECVKKDGYIGGYCDFSASPEFYEFSIAIVEGEPVFRGDVLYNRNGIKFTVETIHEGTLYGTIDAPEVKPIKTASDLVSLCTWNPPQRTIEINGVKVKAADSVLGPYEGAAGEVYIAVNFGKQADAEAFKAAMEGKK